MKKIVLVGGARAGKTQLFKALTEPTYEYNDSYQATIGCHFSTVPYEEEPDKLEGQFWDTAGEERLRVTVISAYNLMSVCLLCFDVRSQESLDKCLEELKTSSSIYSDVQFIFVATKDDNERDSDKARIMDMANYDDFINKMKLQYPSIKIHPKVIFTSALEKKGIDELHEIIKKNDMKPSEGHQIIFSENTRQATSARNSGLFSSRAAVGGTLAFIGSSGLGLFLLLGVLSSSPAILTGMAVLAVVAIVCAAYHCSHSSAALSP